MLALGPAFYSTASVDFVISTIETGKSVSQTVVHGYFRRDADADLVIARIDDAGRRKVSVHEMSDNLVFKAEPIAEFELPENVIGLDVGRLGARDILVFFTPDHVTHYDPFRDAFKPLVSFQSIYNNVVKDQIPVLDLFRDINGDGLDDLAIPGFDGITIFIQQQEGAFSGPVTVHAPPVMEMTYNDYPWYQMRAMFETDMTGNGKNDLVFWLDNQFAIYRQLDSGMFSDDVITQESNVPFEYDGVGGVSFRMGEEDQSKLTARVLYQLKDLDGDGITDLVTLTLNSKGVFNKQTTYEFHKGRRRADGVLVFSEAPVSRIESKGVQFEMEEHDLDDDGQVDIVVSSVQIGIGKIIAALITGSINIDLDFYKMTKGVYPDSPNATRTITSTFNLSSGEVFFPFVLIADVNGDSYADLLVQDGVDTIRIYEGEEGPGLFSRRVVKIKAKLPNDADLVTLADLNGDGRQDVIMRLEKKNEENSVAVLMSVSTREVQ
ncbi:MAG: VCBS repeat-containing protein [Pseudomonadales bacterium]